MTNNFHFVSILLMVFYSLTHGLLAGENVVKKADNVKYETVFDNQPLLNIIDEQLVAIRAGKIERAYSDFTSEAFRKSTSLEAFKEFVNHFNALSKNKYFQFHSFYYENHMGTFQGLLVSIDGDAVQAEYDLVMEDKKWKIYGMQLFKQEMTIIRPEVYPTPQPQ